MTVNEETRASLVLRLGNPADDDAWNEFLQIYEPMLFRLALRWGLQPADASEVVQETLLAVAKAVPSFDRNQHSGAFRGWLASITRNKLADYLARARRQVRGSGDSNVQRWLDQVACDSSDVSIWDWNEKQQVFAWAARKVREHVNANTWQAFHRTCVLGETVSTVARELRIREGMVYVARSRVMARLRAVVSTWDDRQTNGPESRGSQ